MLRTVALVLTFLVLLSGCGAAASGGGLTDSAGQTPEDVARAAMAALEADDQEAYTALIAPRRLDTVSVTSDFSTWLVSQIAHGEVDGAMTITRQPGVDTTQIVRVDVPFAQEDVPFYFWLDRVDGVWRMLDTSGRAEAEWRAE